MTGERYTFDKEIGRGASGPVWSGRDTVLGRAVALKRVGTPPGGISPDAEHGAREARLAAALNHPHVVGVFDLFVSGDEHWLVMEHVAGTTLSQLVRERGPLPGADAAALLAQVAEALDAAHRAGIVHRDVKPSNVLVTPDGTVKLTDFGIARTADDTSLTMTGQVTGSPAYIAPEVATGNPATPASDVWSLGATLYHLLAGRPPYHVGDNVLSTMYRIVHEEPPRLPELGRINHVLERTMSVDPSLRWTTSQVREALDRLALDPAAQVALEGPVRDPRSQPADHDVSPTRATSPVAAVETHGSLDSVGSMGSRSHHTSQGSQGSVRSSAEPTRRPLRWAVWGAAALVVTAVTLAAFNAGLSNADRDGDRIATAPTGSGSSRTPTSPSPTPEQVTAQQLETFVDDYLRAVTADPRTAWTRLTPGFQKKSKGYGSFSGFWGTVASASAREFRTDPARLRVTYVVDYVMQDGSRRSDTVTLRLLSQDGTLLIAGES